MLQVKQEAGTYAFFDMVFIKISVSNLLLTEYYYKPLDSFERVYFLDGGDAKKGIVGKVGKFGMDGIEGIGGKETLGMLGSVGMVGIVGMVG
ncbi:hypothetical protein Tco_0142993, partial [Tanacetum coccineum]